MPTIMRSSRRKPGSRSAVPEETRKIPGQARDERTLGARSSVKCASVRGSLDSRRLSEGPSLNPS